MALVELLQKSGDPVLTRSRGGAERPAPEQYKLSKKLVRVKGIRTPTPLREADFELVALRLTQHHGASSNALGIAEILG